MKKSNGKSSGGPARGPDGRGTASLARRWKLAALAGVVLSVFTVVVAVAATPPSKQEPKQKMKDIATLIAELPQRNGPKPSTTPRNPHQQLDQLSPVPIQKKLAAKMFSGIKCTDERPSMVSVPGARALVVKDQCKAGPRDAFLVGREFAHIHPEYDGSLHAALPPKLATAAIQKGWAEQHPVARMGMIPPNVVMIFGPRDDAELDVVWSLVEASYQYAHPEG